MKDLNKLRKEVFKANKLKGFHEEEFNYEHWSCLVISELMEAIEADRIGNKCDYVVGESYRTTYIMEDDSFKDWFERTIKDTVEDEIADTFIRLLDIAGNLDITINDLTNDEVSVVEVSKFAIGLSLTEYTYYFIKLATSPSSPKEVSKTLNLLMLAIKIKAKDLKIDLKEHIYLKIRYNSLRPYKNGKKY